MSYTSLGSYYEFENHQVFDGTGGFGQAPPQLYQAAAAYGAFGGIRDTFSADQVWADARLGGGIGAALASLRNMGCTPTGGVIAGGVTPLAQCQAAAAALGPVNAAGARATKNIQLALSELGYDPGPADGMWGPRTQGGWDKFKGDAELPVGARPGVTQRSLQVMETKLRAGEAPGRAGLGALGAVALVALAVFGGVALLKKKKGPGRAASPMRLRP